MNVSEQKSGATASDYLEEIIDNLLAVRCISISCKAKKCLAVSAAASALRQCAADKELLDALIVEHGSYERVPAIAEIRVYWDLAQALIEKRND